MLKVKKVAKTYKNGVNALYSIDLVVEEGEFVYIIGSTGSGKSTLTKLINGEEKPTSGTIEVAGIDVGSLKNKHIPKYRRNIGVVFQDYRLIQTKTVFENVFFALEVVGVEKLKARKRVRDVLKLVGLEDKSNSYPHELSGGQQQRAAIARAIANRPSLLIADEPTGNLDPVMSKEIMKILDDINKEENTTILMVTHDFTIVNSMRRRTIRLNSGYIASDFIDGGYNEND